MSVLSIDFGNLYLKLSQSNRGVIEILDDNGSYLINNCISFKEIRNFGNNCSNNLTNFFSNFKNIITNGENQNFSVELNNNKYDINSYHLIGMIINYLSLLNNHQILSISIPDYLKESYRQFLIDSCKVFDLKVFSLINESDSISLDYGFYKSFRQEFINQEKIIFINLNDTNLHLFLTQFENNKIEVFDSVNNDLLGGYKINEIILSFMTNEINEYFQIDISQNKKSYSKIIKECEKLKKILSANQEYNFFIESIYDDYDFSKLVTRKNFDCMIDDYINKCYTEIDKFIEQHQTKNNLCISKIELLGGNSRICKFKELVSNLAIKYNFKLESTLNFDQTVVKGMVLYNSILNGSNNLKEFKLQLKNNQIIEIELNDNCKKILLFEPNIYLPKSNKITFKYQENYKINIYSNGVLIKYFYFSSEEYQPFEKVVVYFKLDTNHMVVISKIETLKKIEIISSDEKLENDVTDAVESNKKSENDVTVAIESNEKSENNVSVSIEDGEKLENDLSLSVEDSKKSENDLESLSQSPKISVNDFKAYNESVEKEKKDLTASDLSEHKPENDLKSEKESAKNLTHTKKFKNVISQIKPTIFNSLEIDSQLLNHIKQIEHKMKISDKYCTDYQEFKNKFESLYFKYIDHFYEINEEKDKIVLDNIVKIIDDDNFNFNLEELKKLYFQFKDITNKIKLF